MLQLAQQGLDLRGWWGRERETESVEQPVPSLTEPCCEAAEGEGVCRSNSARCDVWRCGAGGLTPRNLKEGSGKQGWDPTCW